MEETERLLKLEASARKELTNWRYKMKRDQEMVDYWMAKINGYKRDLYALGYKGNIFRGPKGEKL